MIAQNRLSIIDLQHGDPPLTSEDGSVGAVLNGEIYNYKRLQEELREAGHHLQSKCDTEVLAHLAEDGDAVALARRLDGMYAFATWDGRRERLILGRDRLGKKPLHYWHGAGKLVFASELKGVLAHPDVPCELEERAISAYLTFGYVPSPLTFFKGILSVPPAHVLTLHPGQAPTLQRYWQIIPPGLPGGPPAHDLGLDEAAAELRRLLSAAIQRRLVADVPLGAFLSGGIDSSAIVAVMASILGTPVKTFTIGFESRDGFDERPYARQVAERFGTEHHDAVASPAAIELVERLVWHHDQPFGDSSAIPTFLLNQLARQHVTVALSGDGGDELFAGYERFAGGLAACGADALPPFAVGTGRRLLNLLPEGSARSHVGRLQRFAATVEQGMPWAYLDWISYVPESWRQQLLPERDDWGRADYAERWARTAGARPLDRLLSLNIETYLLDDLLVKMDRTSMAHGLEVRSPFLDTALVEFAVRLKPSLKLQGLSFKRVLKRAVAELLPPEILSRPKRGFGVPLDRWFREDLSGYASSMLGSDARVRKHLSSPALDGLLADHQRGLGQHGHALWTLLTLELFLRRQDW